MQHSTVIIIMILIALQTSQHYSYIQVFIVKVSFFVQNNFCYFTLSYDYYYFDSFMSSETFRNASIV